MPKRLTQKDFLRKADEIHGNKYDYSLVNYVNNRTKIKIICLTHGVFEQRPDDHINGKCGCPKCYRNNKVFNKKNFVRKAKKVHENKYDYLKTIYKNSITKIEITCTKHGIFYQNPNAHLNGQGCPDCCISKKLTTEKFIKKSNKIHNNYYDYSSVNYVNNKTKVKIICPKHGIYTQSPVHHLAGHGCSACNKICPKTSKAQNYIFNTLKQFLDLDIKLEQPIKTRNTILYADIFIPRKNVIVEYNGDYWHCNPMKYNENYFNAKKKMFAHELWKQDKIRKKELEKLGYKVFIVWENDFKKNKDKVIQNLLKKLI